MLGLRTLAPVDPLLPIGTSTSSFHHIIPSPSLLSLSERPPLRDKPVAMCPPKCAQATQPAAQTSAPSALSATA